MRKYQWFSGRILPAIVIAMLLLSSCKPKDSDIQASIDAIRKTTPEMTGVVASVSQGVVTLTGECKDDAAKAISEKAVTVIKGVKQVIDNCTLTPPPPPPPASVVIAPDDPLTKEVADATKDYPGVHSDVKDGVVTLTGEIKRADLKTLMMGLHTLKPKKIDNQLTIK
ncbi:MAG: BON domain-containing protein [Puia sp.]|nr:BON domain-containing protein [Puia sp.]